MYYSHNALYEVYLIFRCCGIGEACKVIQPRTDSHYIYNENDYHLLFKLYKLDENDSHLENLSNL